MFPPQAGAPVWALTCKVRTPDHESPGWMKCCLVLRPLKSDLPEDSSIKPLSRPELAASLPAEHRSVGRESVRTEVQCTRQGPSDKQLAGGKTVTELAHPLWSLQFCSRCSVGFVSLQSGEGFGTCLPHLIGKRFSQSGVTVTYDDTTNTIFSVNDFEMENSVFFPIFQRSHKPCSQERALRSGLNQAEVPLLVLGNVPDLQRGETGLRLGVRAWHSLLSLHRPLPSQHVRCSDKHFEVYNCQQVTHGEP